MRRPPILLLALVLSSGLAAAGASPAHAGGSAETTVLVVNAESPDSLLVANEWVRLRGIPRENVLHLEGVPAKPVLPVAEFRERIWKPIRAWMEQQGVLGRVDLIVYSAGFPYGVDFAEDAKAKGVEMRPPLSPIASLTSMTYLARRVERADPSYLDLQVNGYFRRPDGGTRRPTESEERIQGEADDAIQAKDHAKAAAAYERLLATFPEHFQAWYNLACCQARLGRPEEAMAALRKAFEHGWSRASFTEDDEDLAPLRERADFKALLEAMRGRTMSWQPTRAFSSTAAWKGEAEPKTEGVGEEEVDRYWLSAMLGYTGENGSKVEAVLAYLRTAAAADGTNPQGTFYFLENDDVRANTREPMFPDAIATLRAMGRKAETLTKGADGQDGVLPCAKDDVAGLVAGIAGFDWAKCGSRILPGAIAEHLTSFGAHFGTSGQTKCTKFLEAGAAGSSGTVAEPYAIPHKFPVPQVHVHYARGCSMAEAMYQSVYGPYQLLVLGDPLARPFATFAKVGLGAPDGKAPWKGEVAVTPAVAAAEGHPLGRIELWVDGRYVAEAPAGQPIPWDTTRGEDGSREVRLVAVEAGPIATRSATVFRVKVHNGSLSAKATPPKGATPLDGAVKLAGSAKGCETVEIRQGARVLATVPAKSGSWKAEFPAGRLGVGTAVLQVRGVGSGKAVLSDPFEVTVSSAAPPPATPDKPDDPKKKDPKKKDPKKPR